jgi:hypothetical protein
MGRHQGECAHEEEGKVAVGCVQQAHLHQQGQVLRDGRLRERVNQEGGGGGVDGGGGNFDGTDMQVE